MCVTSEEMKKSNQTTNFETGSALAQGGKGRSKIWGRVNECSVSRCVCLCVGLSLFFSSRPRIKPATLSQTPSQAYFRVGLSHTRGANYTPTVIQLSPFSVAVISANFGITFFARCYFWVCRKGGDMEE